MLSALGRKIRAKRKQIGLSQEAFAHKCGFDRTWLSTFVVKVYRRFAVHRAPTKTPIYSHILLLKPRLDAFSDTARFT